MAKAIGIDLGTTNSAAGMKTLDTEILLNAEGEPLTPSVVSYQKGTGLFKSSKLIVGRPALDWMPQDPENTVISIKRLMGRNFADEEVQRLLGEQRYAYRVKPLSTGSEHSVAVLLAGKEYTPEQISAKILEKIKVDAKKRLGETVEYAVVTVPAYFNDKQKHATRIAAALAGLKVQRLLPEPTAAAISFGVDALAAGEAKTILVFDLGGGTFDISVLTIAEGQFIEQGKGGDMWMGGDDIDALISQYVYQQTERDNDVDNLQNLVDRLPAAERNRFMGDLKRNVETAKIRLSTSDQAFIEILGLLRDEDGDIMDVEVELNRKRFEELLQPFVDRCITLTRKVIEGIDFDLELIDKVVMVGGSSSIPLVVQRMKELFGDDKVLVHERPMLAIAEGAAILAHRLSGSYECPGCGREVSQADRTCSACGFDLEANIVKRGVVDIVHTIAHDYFLELEDGSGHLLANRNTPLPFKTQDRFKLIHPEQQLAHLKFYNLVNDIKESIGDLWLGFELPEEGARKEASEVLLDFEIDDNNIISVSAHLADRPDVHVNRTLSRGNADERLFLDLERSIARVNEAKHEYYTKHDFLHRSVAIAGTINRVIDPETGQQDSQASQEVARLLEVANEMVDKEQSALGNIYYAEEFKRMWARFMKEGDEKRLENKLRVLKDRYEHGSISEILRAREEVKNELDKYPGLLAVQDLENAADIAAKEDPAKAPRYEKYFADVQSALMKGDEDTFRRLLNEIMPEVYTIIGTAANKDLHIWKEIRK
jgi:molecular chaperone DnaK